MQRDGRIAAATGGLAGYKTSRVAWVVGSVKKSDGRGEIFVLDFVHAARKARDRACHPQR
jgi:hypothetical protein